MSLQHDDFHREIYREMSVLINTKHVSCAERSYIRHLEHIMNDHLYGKERIKRHILTLKEQMRQHMKPDTAYRRIVAKLYHFNANVARRTYHLLKKGTAIAKKFLCKAKCKLYNHLKEESNSEFYAPLDFVQKEKPLVSIIIAVFNKFPYTYHCLESILRNCLDVDYEVLIVDDCSSDSTVSLPLLAPNIRYFRNKSNQGFLLNCNLMAKQAHGKYIVLLNNDTLVHENWLQSLLALIERDETIGMVGSKMLYANGTLQEAGAIIWQDADGSNYGRGKSPDSSDCNYVKDVDYISGASVLIRKRLWEQINGFDPLFSPAYFEDSDFAFAVRKLGYRVVYQPQSVVTHFERVSYGQDVSGGTLARIAANRNKFIHKWDRELLLQLPKSPANLFRARDRSMNRKIMLMMDDYVPMWDHNAGAKTTYNYLLIFRELGYQIIFAAVNEFNHPEPYTSALQQLGIEVFYGQYNRELFTRWLKEYGRNFDIVFINRPHVANQYLDTVKEFSHAVIAYYGHDLHYLREQREYELTHNMVLLKRSHHDYANEMNIMNKADIVLSVSPLERDLINQNLGKPKAVASPIFFYKNRNPNQTSTTLRKGLLFVGGFTHSPNADGIVWFVKEIWPLICKELPSMKLTIAGNAPTNEVKALRSNDITVTGWLSDVALDAVYAQHRVCIIPLRYGAGVKGKTTDALYHGLPIVSTAIGLEGLPEIEQVATAYDAPKEFADEVVRLYCLADADWDTVRQKEQDYINQHFGFNTALQLFSNVFGSGLEKEGVNR